MSIIVQRGKPPEDAVQITQEEAANLQWKLIYNWKPSSDIWPFRYGVMSLSLGTALSAFLVATHFRRKLKLRNIGNFMMYFPNVVIPTITLPIFHQKFISEPILLQTDCPVCIQLRSIFVQNSMGLLYPLAMSTVSGFMVANTYATVRLPILALSNLREFFAIYRNIVRPFTTRLFGLSLFHTVLALAITEAEARSLFKVQKVLLERANNNNADITIQSN